MTQVGLIGIGYWGPNLARSLELTGKSAIAWLCDIDTERLTKVAPKYPRAKVTASVDDVLRDRSVDAVAISTPVRQHYELARRALEADKHVLVEKPITGNAEAATALIELAERKRKTLMVGHVFEYNASIWALKRLIESGELGEIHYLYFERTNLGPVRTDVNVLWDLASHDISIMNYLLGQTPRNVTARGQAYLNGTIEDAAFATFTFSNGVMAHINVSWINPRKIRQIIVTGSKKMAVWDDLNLLYPIQIFDKRVEQDDEVTDTFLGHKTKVVDGGMHCPITPLNQPLQAECDHFIECIQHGRSPQTDGFNGLRVVLALEAATASMKHGSIVTPIPDVKRYARAEVNRALAVANSQGLL